MHDGIPEFLGSLKFENTTKDVSIIFYHSCESMHMFIYILKLGVKIRQQSLSSFVFFELCIGVTMASNDFFTQLDNFLMQSPEIYLALLITCEGPQRLLIQRATCNHLNISILTRLMLKHYVCSLLTCEFTFGEQNTT